MSELEQLVRGFFAALDSGDLDRVAAAIDPGCAFEAPGFTLHGPGEIVGWMRHFIDAFPDVRHRVVEVVTDGERAATELEITGTHTAPLSGPAGTVEPTGRS